MYTKIIDVIRGLNTESVSQERREVLRPLVAFIQSKVEDNEQVSLNFICTHNSRRSHLSQIWAQAMAAHFGVQNIFCYSGGTEATAMFPMAAKTLVKSGFEIKVIGAGDNPIYSVKYSDTSHPVIAFSKTYDDSFNPQSGYAAIMTCSSADNDCPIVIGSEKRIPITYEDPKAFDGTPIQEEKYLERSLQIATEMLFVFSQLK